MATNQKKKPVLIKDIFKDDIIKTMHATRSAAEAKHAKKVPVIVKNRLNNEVMALIHKN